MTNKNQHFMKLLTDYAFKKNFGTEQNKDLLIDFLNTVLEDEQKFVNLEYKPNERLGINAEDRKVIFDLLCENDRGEKILVELQQAKQNNFKSRALYYASCLIQEQGERGAWDYQLSPTYVVAICNFPLNLNGVIHRVFLMDQDTHQKWSKDIQLTIIDLSVFQLAQDDCLNPFHQWLFLLKNMHLLEKYPRQFHKEVFLKLFSQAEIGKFSEKERVHYLSSLTEMEQMEEAIKCAAETAAREGHQQGLQQGLQQGRQEGIELGRMLFIQELLLKGMDWAEIEELTKVNQKAYDDIISKNSLS